VPHSPRLGRAFWQLWAATGVSSLGDGLILVGFPLLALTFTHNSLAIAGVVVVGQLPGLLVALPAGALADRANRRRLLVRIEVVRFVILAAFATVVITGHDGLAAIYLTVFGLGMLGFVFQFASSACLPAMVPPGTLVQANAHLLTVDLTAEEMVGQALGGMAFAAAASIPFAADAVSFAASAGLLRLAVPDNAPSSHESSLLEDLRAGLRYFRRAPVLRLLSELVASLAFCQAIVLSVLVLYATEDLHLSNAGYGFLLAAGATGNIVGALGARGLHRRLGTGWCLIAAGLTAALAYPVMALTSSPIAASGAMALEAIGVMLGNVTSRSLRQSLVPQGLMARVASVHQMIVLAALPLGGLVGGLLTGQIGLRSTFLLAGGLQLAVLIVAAPSLIKPVGRHSANMPFRPAPRLPKPVVARARPPSQIDHDDASHDGDGGWEPVPAEIFLEDERANDGRDDHAGLA
jgi:MFS family permease